MRAWVRRCRIGELGVLEGVREVVFEGLFERLQGDTSGYVVISMHMWIFVVTSEVK